VLGIAGSSVMRFINSALMERTNEGDFNRAESHSDRLFSRFSDQVRTT
jgi:hypothetical protein